MQTAPAPMPVAARLREFALTGLLFVAAYGACNQLTASRTDIGAAVFAWERHTPFVPWTIVPYLSVIGFFVLSFFLPGDRRTREQHVARLLAVLALSVACYLLVPLQFQFERPAVEGPVGGLYRLLSLCDLPYNRAPSLHISVLVLLWLRLSPLLGGVMRTAVQGWFLLIGVSVLTTWQHHVIDIPAGLAAAAAAAWLVKRWTATPVQRALRMAPRIQASTGRP